MTRKRRLDVRSSLTLVLRRLVFFVPATILLVIHPTMRGEAQGKAEHSSPPNELAPRTLLTLPQLTCSSSALRCPDNLILVANIDNLLSSSRDVSTRKIPKTVHQTSKSRCITQKVAKAAREWSLRDGWSYFFHDDDAVMRLLQHEFPEFPHLALIARNCLAHGTLKADLWRYLVLWVFGGVYADIDAVPAKFTTDTIDAVTDDAFFVVEQFHLLSQWFMAASPRHPLMYYAVQQSLSNLLTASDTGSIPASLFTGPRALHAAYIQFRRDAGDDVGAAVPGTTPVGAGHYVGSHNRTVTVVGIAADQNEYVNRDVLGVLKQREYHKMGMRHFQEDTKYTTGRSCKSSMLDAFYRAIDAPF